MRVSKPRVPVSATTNNYKMSFTACKTFANVASKLLRSNKLISNGAVQTRIPVFVSRGLQTQRSFTRSMWVMSRQNDNRPPLTSVKHDTKWTSKACGCCGLHTKGDQELVEFLSEEISHEKKLEKAPGSLPKLKGFSIKTDGTLVTLVKEADGETVTIEMNINHSVEDASGIEYDQPENAEQGAAEMVARPPFTVRFNKGSDLTLALQCDFASNDEMQPPAEGEDEYEDLIEISEAALLSGSEWDDKIYSVSGSVMDGNLYDMLMNMMEERGIDGTFMDEMVLLATAYDHKQYISFLENLKSFTGK